MNNEVTIEQIEKVSEVLDRLNIIATEANITFLVNLMGKVYTDKSTMVAESMTFFIDFLKRSIEFTEVELEMLTKMHTNYVIYSDVDSPLYLRKNIKKKPTSLLIAFRNKLIKAEDDLKSISHAIIELANKEYSPEVIALISSFLGRVIQKVTGMMDC